MGNGGWEKLVLVFSFSVMNGIDCNTHESNGFKVIKGHLSEKADGK